jgi:hypothetical protein
LLKVGFFALTFTRIAYYLPDRNVAIPSGVPDRKGRQLQGRIRQDHHGMNMSFKIIIILKLNNVEPGVVGVVILKLDNMNTSDGGKTTLAL